MDVSIVVPTLDRPDLLERCLKALTVQQWPPQRYEILVVDDAASPETAKQLQRWQQRLAQGPSLRYHTSPGHRGPAAARNIGWRHARGQVIAFTDDDTVPQPDWLKHGMAAFAPGVIAVSGRVVVPLPADPTDYQRNESQLAQAEFVTANAFVRRAVLESLGGFDERFTAAWREDSELHFRLLDRAEARGERLVRAARAVVVHPLRPAPWGVSLRQQSKSRFNALLYKLHPRRYGDHIQHQPPWHYYLAVGLVLGGLAGWVLQAFPVALAALAGWFTVTLRFCLCRLRHTSRRFGHVLEMLFTSTLIPFLSVYWRLYGALRFRVCFL